MINNRMYKDWSDNILHRYQFIAMRNVIRATVGTRVRCVFKFCGYGRVRDCKLRPKDSNWHWHLAAGRKNESIVCLLVQTSVAGCEIVLLLTDVYARVAAVWTFSHQVIRLCQHRYYRYKRYQLWNYRSTAIFSVKSPLTLGDSGWQRANSRRLITFYV